MKNARHFADLGKSADFFQSFGNNLVISSKLVKLTGPDNGGRPLLEDVVRGPPREQLVIILLIFKVFCVQFKGRGHNKRPATEGFIIDLVLVFG